MADGTCSVDGCSRTGKLTRGWCRTHYMRVVRHGNPQADIPVRDMPPLGSLCTADGCDRPRYALGFCGAHRARFLAHGNPLVSQPIRQRIPERATCSVNECRERPVARSWCQRHYMRWRIHGDTNVYLYGRPPEPCTVVGCARSASARGWCPFHYNRWLATGGVQADIPPRYMAWTSETCTENGCVRPVAVRDLCRRHYAMRRATEVRADPVRYARRLAAARRHHASAMARDPERIRRRDREWRAKHPELTRAREHRKRSARLQARTIPFTAEQLADRLRYYGFRCWMCGGPYEALDHVKPVSRGGWHALANIRPACKSDNSSKKDRWPYPTRTFISVGKFGGRHGDALPEPIRIH